jgi:hypothetical protein
MKIGRIKPDNTLIEKGRDSNKNMEKVISYELIKNKLSVKIINSSIYF